MRTCILSILLVLSVGFITFAHNGTPKKSDNSSADIKLNKIDSPMKIFFQDENNKTLFIDFDLVLDNITEINILKEDALMMEDDVTDLPGDTIYEINLGIIRSGTYQIEVVTSDGNFVRKKVTVK